MKYYDLSWNPLCGCEKCSPGCDNCGALKNLVKQGRPIAPQVKFNTFERLPEAKGVTYMVCSQTDVFHPAFDDSYVEEVFEALCRNRESTFLICTKRVERMRSFFDAHDFPESPNVFMGVSVESREYMGRAETLAGLDLPFRKWLCLEPLLGGVDVSNVVKGMDWVFVSAEREEGRRPCRLEWVEKVVSQCKGVPCFVNMLDIDGVLTDDVSQFPPSLAVREYAWDKGEPMDYVEEREGYGTVKKIGPREFEVASSVRVYSYFASEPMWDCYEVRLVSSEPRRFTYIVKVKKIPRKPFNDFVKSYWHIIRRNIKE